MFHGLLATALTRALAVPELHALKHTMPVIPTDTK